MTMLYVNKILIWWLDLNALSASWYEQFRIDLNNEVVICVIFNAEDFVGCTNLEYIVEVFSLHNDVLFKFKMFPGRKTSIYDSIS